MQRSVTHRSLALSIALAFLTACHPSMHSAAGETPAPSQTTQSQANSTAAPASALSDTPAEKYFAKVAPGTHGVVFSVWANGRPIATTFTPGQSIDLTSDMRGHANRIAVQWERRSKNGAGMLTVAAAGKPPVMIVKVNAKSVSRGQTSKTFIANQAPTGR